MTLSKTSGKHKQITTRNSKMTDEKIMAMINDGDKKKIGLLFDRYHILLFNFFLKRNINKAVSEDLTQNVFEKIIKYSYSFNSNYTFKAWMYRIARNILNDHFSKNKIHEQLETSKIGETEASVIDQIEQNERMTQLQKALALLSEKDRELIQLARFQKLKYHEIASVLNISESGVKMRMLRAMKKLKEQYLKLEDL